MTRTAAPLRACVEALATPVPLTVVALDRRGFVAESPVAFRPGSLVRVTFTIETGLAITVAAVAVRGNTADVPRRGGASPALFRFAEDEPATTEAVSVLLAVAPGLSGE